ncbi:hypothetical protein C8J56DRAFT_1163730 [Mycena floridula]|nr:hypothetical protein C8J56DRAFT_1163730 [Mycena floridula]
MENITITSAMLEPFLSNNLPVPEPESRFLRQYVLFKENQRQSMICTQMLEFLGCGSLSEVRDYIQQANWEQTSALVAKWSQLQEEFGASQVETECLIVLLPLRSLPSELLSEIFVHCMPAKPETISPRNPPFTLSSVCSRWRAVAVSTPKIWTGLVFGSVERRHIELTKIFISRSGAIPLDISFRWFSQEEEGLENEIRNLCIPELHRWKTFSFESYREETDLPIAISPDLQAPHLSEVSYSPRCLDDALWGVSVVRSAADTLRSLRWTNDTGLANLAAILLPKLTSLTLGTDDGISLPHFIQILNQCPLLTTCYITLSDIDRSSASGIVHANLKDLQCKFNCFDDEDWTDVLQKMMDSLTVPALLEFYVEVLHGRHDSTIWPQEAFLSMLQRSRCSLKDLSLFGVVIPNNFQACFSGDGLKNLERLWFHFTEPIYYSYFGANIPCSLIRALSIAKGQASPVLLPKLREFGTFLQSYQTSALSNMAISRLEAGYAVKVGLAADEDDEYKQELDDLVQELSTKGVDVYILYSPLEM